MKRREFITLLGGAATAWPFAASSQQPQQLRRIGMLMNVAAESSEAQPRLMAFKEALQQLGWNEHDNVRIEVRWGANNTDRDRRYAAELVALAPDVILARDGTPHTRMHRGGRDFNAKRLGQNRGLCSAGALH